MRIPPSFTRIQSYFVGSSSRSMFSLEFSENVTDIEEAALYESQSLRNIAIPCNTQVQNNAFSECTDLKQLFDSEKNLIHALQHRFDNLPIHKMIYYPHNNSITVDQLNNALDMRPEKRSLHSKLKPSSKQQDCLGMTPLHIMACSTIQNLKLYRLLVEKYPENLITKDRWGAIPLLYAVWGNAPEEIIQFLVNSYRSLFPYYELNWTKLVETLCHGNATTSSIQMLLDVQQDFPHQNIDWYVIMQKAATNKTHVVLADVFRFLTEHSYSSRIDAIGIKQWREDLILEIDKRMQIENETMKHIAKYALSRELPRRNCWLFGFSTKLARYEARYEELKEATTLIELVLWKNKINEVRSTRDVESRKKMKLDREQFRINCGADIIIAHVLHYLVQAADPSCKVTDRRERYNKRS